MPTKEGRSCNGNLPVHVSADFSNRSMYMNFISGRNTPAFAKDTVYRFMKMIQINWIRFTTILAGRIIKEAIRPLDSEERVNVLIIDDSMYERNRSKK